eukprot:CAMPEP_0172609876 /NCGR_PEP_ID=MMETSP1068-20121228/29775_1 /TAXON_ID=35684 /ORGANISM="Pseudopedinella elastica, Strain CCMP716" /LENGTH=56 /DNA_ID=CAMNT_0013413481 /DNA_START=63 /DNA_END=230 /DNA_ORIENTATION=-
MGFLGSKKAFGANDGGMELHLKRAVGCFVKYPTKPQETADSAAIVGRLVAGFECAL